MSSLVGYSVGILVVSDSVFAGEKCDRSGVELERVLLTDNCFGVCALKKECVDDNQPKIENFIKSWADSGKLDLILTVGGTGFSPRDVTPEATKAVIEKEAPHLASYMILQCCAKTKYAALSRSVCGIRGHCLILNLPGSTKGATECFEAVASLLPHAMDQLKCNKENVIADHEKIQRISTNFTELRTTEE